MTINIVLSLSNYVLLAMLTKYTLSITDLHICGKKEKNGDAFRVSLRCITQDAVHYQYKKHGKKSNVVALSRPISL